MSNPIPIPSLTKTQEFGAAPLTKKLATLDEVFKYNSNLLDETVFDKTPLSRNDPWLKSRALLADTYGTVRQEVEQNDLRSRLQAHANTTGAQVDGSLIYRILEGGEVDEEEDSGGAVRSIVESWQKEIASKPAIPLRKGGGTPPLTSYPLLNPKDEKEVLGHVSIFGDE
jgi:hypothetical protein